MIYVLYFITENSHSLKCNPLKNDFPMVLFTLILLMICMLYFLCLMNLDDGCTVCKLS